MFLYFPQFLPMTSPGLQSKKSRKRQARTRMLVVCLQYCVERWAEHLKDTHSVLAWRRHKSPIVDLSLCVFVSVCMSRIGFLCLNCVCRGKKNESVQRPAALHCVCIFVSYTIWGFSIAAFVVAEGCGACICLLSEVLGYTAIRHHFLPRTRLRWQTQPPKTAAYITPPTPLRV